MSSTSLNEVFADDPSINIAGNTSKMADMIVRTAYVLEASMFFVALYSAVITCTCTNSTKSREISTRRTKYDPDNLYPTLGGAAQDLHSKYPIQESRKTRFRSCKLSDSHPAIRATKYTIDHTNKGYICPEALRSCSGNRGPVRGGETSNNNYIVRQSVPCISFSM